MEIVIGDDTGLSGSMLERLRYAAELCAEGEGLEPSAYEVSLSLVSEYEIHSLNRTYRGIDRATDVLSFPQFDDPGELAGAAAGLPEGENVSLGDVVICEAVARRQALEYGHSYERELVYLFVHSVLHLLGYDHMEESEKEEMREAEERVMAETGLKRE